MSYTPVQNRFWSDGWVRGLNALDRYLFLYLLTNGRASLTGIYELPIDLMASESGIDEKDLRLSMLVRLEPKVYYKEGWVILVNYLKHRVSSSPQYLKGIENEFKGLPPHIREIALSCGYPIDTLSIPSRIRIDKNRIDIPAYAELKEVSDSEEEFKDSKSPKISGDKKKAYDELISWSEKERGFSFPKTTRIKQYRAFKLANQEGIKRDKLMERWEEMSVDKFWQRAGFDWMNVVQDILKKP